MENGEARTSPFERRIQDGREPLGLNAALKRLRRGCGDTTFVRLSMPLGSSREGSLRLSLTRWSIHLVSPQIWFA